MDKQIQHVGDSPAVLLSDAASNTSIKASLCVAMRTAAICKGVGSTKWQVACAHCISDSNERASEDKTSKRAINATATSALSDRFLAHTAGAARSLAEHNHAREFSSVISSNGLVAFSISFEASLYMPPYYMQNPLGPCNRNRLGSCSPASSLTYVRTDGPYKNKCFFIDTYIHTYMHMCV